jgi:hypothetical protein
VLFFVAHVIFFYTCDIFVRIGGVAVGRGFEPQSDLELFFTEILINSEEAGLCKAPVFRG